MVASTCANGWGIYESMVGDCCVRNVEDAHRNVAEAEVKLAPMGQDVY
jgi:hypothetical protein